MKKIYIIKTGSTFKATRDEFQDFEEWIIERSSASRSGFVTVDVQAGEPLPDLDLCGGIIVTGSHSMVTDEEGWSQTTGEWLADAVVREVPLLAICYGHQLLAKALGGVSDYHGSGMEIGTVGIALCEEARDDLLFCDMPGSFDAHTIHSQTVLTLPDGAIRLASNAHDTNHAFRVGRNAWGVQFHPEFGKGIMDSYIKEVSKTHDLDGYTQAALLENTRETHEATSLLKRFTRIVLG